MNRRILLAAALGFAAPPARAQPALPVVGFLRSAAVDDMAAEWLAAFRRGLREAGYEDGRNVAIEVRGADGSPARLATLVQELIERPARVIFGNNAAALAALRATRSIPIVFATGGDPIRDGLVASLSRPGGNVTGVTFLDATVSAKQLELLRELVPAATTLGLVADTSTPTGAAAARDAAAAAAAMGLRLVLMSARSDAEIDAAFAAFAAQRVGGFMASGAAAFSSRRRRLVALAAQHRLPGMYEAREFAAAGGLMSYGGSIPEAYRQAGLHAGRILAGADPGSLPVFQSTRVELVINLAVARALGLAVPPMLLSRADEVIE